MDLEKELTCSICTDLLYQPLTLLDCLHTFCGACLKEWFSWQAIAAESRHAPPPRPGAPVFTCPSCRAAVRSTKHNATVATLLDMVLTTNPEKRKPADEQAEMDAKYRPGEDVLPKLHIPVRTPEQQRLDEAERRLIDEVRERSRQEAVAAASGGNPAAAASASSHRSRSRSHARHGSSSRSGSGTHHHHHHNPSASSSTGAAREARQRQRLLTPADAEAAVAAALEDDSRHHSGERRHRRSTSSRHAADASPSRSDAETTAPASELAGDAPGQRIVGHQSSLRLLISGSEPRGGATAASPSASPGNTTVLDIEREIEEFARQIQEEGLLDGLDLDNIDPTNNDELSRKIAEAYDRRQRGRAQQADSARRHHRRNTSDVSRTSASDARHHGAPPHGAQQDHSPRASTLAVPAAGAGAGAGGRPPSASSRTSSRQRSYSQSSQESRLSARAQTAAVPSPLAADVEAAQATAAAAAAAAPARASRPPSRATVPSTHLDVQDTAHHHQRRRTASEGRTGAPRPPPKTTTTTSNRASGASLSSAATEPVTRFSARSQTDLPLRPAELPGADFTRPVELPGSLASAPSPGPGRPSASLIGNPAPRSASHPPPSLPAELPASAGGGGRATSFQARALALGLELQGQHEQQQQRLPPVATAQFVQSPTTTDRHGATGHSSPLAQHFPQQPQPPPSQQPQQPQQHQQHQRQHSRTVLYPEPDITCARCGRRHIEYDVHYNCVLCRGGDWNICMDCYRRGRGCEHWFGFGYAAWHKWEKEKALLAAEAAAAVADGKGGAAPPPLAKPHMLTANRYLPPHVVPGGAEGRRTLTPDNPEDRLQSGVFCAGCQAWANSCYWRCDVCNQGDWGFCNDCVNQGRVCSHPLLPLTHEPVEEAEAAAAAAAATAERPASASLPAEPPRPHASSLLALPRDVSSSAPAAAGAAAANAAFRIGSFRALTFLTTCDHCRATIAPSSARFHCYTCTSSVVPDTHAGDYDLCENCYTVVLPGSGLLADENGAAGWRRCPKAGHRMVVVAFRETAGDSSGKVSSRVSSIPRRVVLQDLVGGWRLEAEDVAAAAAAAAAGGPAREGSTAISAAAAMAAAAAATPDLQTWYIWFGGERLFERPVSRDVRRNAGVPLPAPFNTPNSTAVPQQPTTAPFPPAGGVGVAGVARWAYYPEAGADDELAFPKHAEIREIEDVNGEWFHGVYMGRRGLFPGSFVHVIRR